MRVQEDFVFFCIVVCSSVVVGISIIVRCNFQYTILIVYTVIMSEEVSCVVLLRDTT